MNRSRRRLLWLCGAAGIGGVAGMAAEPRRFAVLVTLDAPPGDERAIRAAQDGLLELLAESGASVAAVKRFRFTAALALQTDAAGVALLNRRYGADAVDADDAAKPL